jgi:hypothetical protein
VVPPNSDVQHSSTGAQAIYQLEHASIEDLERATMVAIRNCKAQFPEDTAFKHLQWAANQRDDGTKNAYKYEMAQSQKAKRYDDIRSLFSRAEKGDNDLRNKLYCYSGSDIDKLMSLPGTHRGTTPIRS